MRRLGHVLAAWGLVVAGCGGGKQRADGGATTGGDSGESAAAGQGNGNGTAVPGLDSRPRNASCVAPARPQPASSVTLERAFGGLGFDRPLGMFQPPGESSYWYVIEQGGTVRRFENRADVETSSVVAQVTVPFSGGNDERGLLGMAFHPDFERNRYVYLSYIAITDLGDQTRIERYTVSEDGGSFDSPQVILEELQPAPNHNGGHIAFGPDGYLYIGLGDGGGADDSFENGQDPSALLGAMLRIDVDGGSPYAIPADNPFADGGGAPEVYAWGLRNPWRWSFDSLTGELWLGDVGQNCYEEVDRVERGDNLGWPLLEGFTCFSPDNDDNGCPDDRSCAAASDPAYTAPVFMYPQSEGVSVTGGYVYRGSRIPALEGTYLFADFATGKIWGTRSLPGGDFETEELLDSDAAVASFAQAPDGELFVLDRATGGIYSIEPGRETAVETLPRMLSETGCADPEDPTRVAEGVLPYDLRVRFWSDGADKERFLALPEGETLTVDARGDWTLPPGGVTMKTFRLDGKPVETRFFVRYPDGSFGGYTYAWNDAGSDAVLLDTRQTRSIDGQTWYFPSRGECMGCHTAAAGYSLGLESRQLDKAIEYPGGRLGNQILTLDQIGYFASDQTLPEDSLAMLEDRGAPLEARARAYLHVNCSQCHQPGAPGRGTADLRIDAAERGLCDAHPTAGDLGIEGARLLAPGAPERSLIAVRAGTRGPDAMPPVASNLVDEAGVELLREWIASLDSCP